MRIAVTLVIDMTDDQLKDYIAFAGIPAQPTGHVRAADVVASVRGCLLGVVRDTYPFAERDNGTGGAGVSIKER